MSGAGFAMDAIKRTRGNRSLIKKKGAFETQKGNTFGKKALDEPTMYTFIKPSSSYLISLREQLRKDKARRLLNTSIALAAAAVATIYFLTLCIKVEGKTYAFPS